MSRTAILILLAAAATTAQRAHAQFTIKAGASFASTTESDLVPDVSNRTGFAGGVGYGFRLGGELLSLRAELFYVQKGGDLGDEGTLEIDELNVPLLAQFNIPIDFLSPFAYAGPQAEYELDCTRADIDCVDTESFRWGAVLGVGVRFAQRLTGELRYNWTLTDVSELVDSKPRTLLLLAGIEF
jgi:hypothetical protein